jgi:hypothetical protein
VSTKELHALKMIQKTNAVYVEPQNHTIKPVDRKTLEVLFQINQMAAVASLR